MNKKSSQRKAWTNGIKDGIPICLGYIAVSFTFGIMAKSSGLTSSQAVIMSATNLTSAGQFASLALISTSSSYIEMAITQLVINIRYCLMSFSLAQKFDPKTAFAHRLFVAFGITDEIFGVSVVREGKLNPYYNYGLMTISISGWVLGTLLGVLSGGLLPPRIISALSVALYGMFIAIIVPPARGNKVLTGIIIFSMGLSFLFTKVSILSPISSGTKIIVLTLLIAGAAALLFPIKEGTDER
ncbi:AzlC family ABC transporter permease [Dehalobacter sp. DCM]|uniref:AzlC family ABC transporter permease n=1 Tax=Dehalobacter sp. DCM TaxID=2907827 RepID=UPI0030818F1D|nr:AzlC family ABC transporter permease [Dehalobacter sp. DCM]